MAGLTLLRVVGNDDLVRQEREQVERELAARQSSPVMLGLTAYLKQCWDAARIARDPITDIMLQAMRQRNGEYAADKLQAIRSQGGSEVCRGGTGSAFSGHLYGLIVRFGPNLDPVRIRQVEDFINKNTGAY